MRFDFATIMVLLVVVSGGIWAFDAWILAPRRRRAGEGPGADGSPGQEQPLPKVVDYARSFFPVFLVVLLLRSFLVEPFRIPSGSMLPTLEIGDFILVNKYVYGIRLPVLDTKVVELGRPARGDVVVFRFPPKPSTPFIKRVVGLPGDRVDYFNKVLYINGEPIKHEFIDTYTGKGSARDMTGAMRRFEHLGDVDHHILVRPTLADTVTGGTYPYVPMVVPDGHYFVLGDNRDNSRDSRYWGTVPDENLIGKAFTVWMNLDWGEGIDWSRIGTSIR